MPSLLVCELGTRPYAETLELQRAVARARIAGRLAEDLLLLVEHPPVITLGRSSRAAHLVASPDLLAARGIEVHEVERGGDVTFHGPGQLVGYAIIDLKRHRQDLHWFLRQVEESLIRALAPLGIVAERSPGLTGVWTGDRKLASIGVHAREWVTWHGFALNVTTDLTFFDLMVPCGIADVAMTSVARELEHAHSEEHAPDTLGARVRHEVATSMAEVFSLEVGQITPAALTQLLAAETVPSLR